MDTFHLGQIELFFLHDLKCFRIRLDQVYDRDQFHFSSNNNQVLRINFTEYVREKLFYFLTVSRETGESSKVVNLKYRAISKFLIGYEISIQDFEDRFSFLRRPPESNEPSFRSLDVTVENPDLKFELEDEPLFQQLYSIEKQKSSKRITHHVRGTFIGPDFGFNLVFLQQIVLSTNAVNYSTLILCLLSLLCTWFEVDMLVLRPLYLYLRDYLFGYLCIYLPICLANKITQILLLISKWTKKLESALYEFKSLLYECLKSRKRTRPR